MPTISASTRRTIRESAVGANLLLPKPELERLRTQSPVPYYFRLYELLKKKIISGDLTQDCLLPSEACLAEYLEVSRITVGKSLQRLAQERLVQRERGLGTFVLHTQSTGDAAVREISHAWKIDLDGCTLDIAVHKILAPKQSANFDAAQRVANGKRLYIQRQWKNAKREPIALDESCTLLEDDCDDSKSGESARRQILAQHSTSSDLTVSAPSSAARDWLAMDSGAPVLRSTRTTTEATGRVLDVRVSQFRADRVGLRSAG